ncbi:MAG: nitroreductase family deazaflavin-dependent oxidoreductase [Acidimicrobiia bacterium]
MATTTDLVNRFMGAAHATVFRLTKGRVGGKIGAHDVVLLTTTGRRTGQPRTVPLTYLPDGDRFVLIASNGGRDRHPAWYLNVTANPTVTVRLGGDTRTMRARVATPDEKAELWPRVVNWWKRYDGYQQKTERDIPLVIVEEPVTG